MITFTQTPGFTRGRRFATAVMVVFFTTLLQPPAPAADPEPHLETSTRIIYNIYQPAYQRFAASSQHLSSEISTLCETKNTSQVVSVKSAFAQTVAAFSEVEFYRVGPMLQDNRQNRLLYWPDKRRAGQRQLRALLADSTDFNNTSIRDKSVTLQGFPALERLLFDHAAETELSSPGNQRCLLAQTVAAHIAELAGELLSAWSDPAGIQQQILQPTTTSALFRSEAEVLRSYMTQLSAGLEFLITRKLEPLIAELEINKLKSNYKTSIRKAPFWKSDLFLSNVKGNVIGLRALLIDSGIATQASLENELNFEFSLAQSHINKLSSINMLTEDGVTLNSEAQQLLLALIMPLASIQVTIGDRIAETLGVSAGFNSDDGD